MSRFFLDVSYLGYAYSGSQIQLNGLSIQAFLEEVLSTFLKEKITLVGGSRTDAGVHAYQNFFHFDTEKNIIPKQVYNLNSMLPFDIAINNIYPVNASAHCRFDALKRSYKYLIHQTKNPFLQQRSYYYPYKINGDCLKRSARFILTQTNFESFSKIHTQVKTFECQIDKSEWQFNPLEKTLMYQVSANRFLRGMVKALVATQLLHARGLLSFDELEGLFKNPSPAKANFSSPSHGLYLTKTEYPKDFFI